MRDFFLKTKHSVTRLQNADLTTRKRWFVGLSSVSAILLIVLWIMYLNATIPSSYNGNITEGTTTEETAPTTREGAIKSSTNISKNSFFETMERGLLTVWNKIRAGTDSLLFLFKNLWNGVTEKLRATNSFEIKKQSNDANGAVNILDPIPPAPLPKLPETKEP